MAEEETNIVEITDENGDTYEVEVVDIVTVDDVEYAVLAPVLREGENDEEEDGEEENDDDEYEYDEEYDADEFEDGMYDMEDLILDEEDEDDEFSYGDDFKKSYSEQDENDYDEENQEENGEEYDSDDEEEDEEENDDTDEDDDGEEFILMRVVRNGEEISFETIDNDDEFERVASYLTEISERTYDEE